MLNQNDNLNDNLESKGHLLKKSPFFIEFRPSIKDKYMSFIYSKGQKILCAIYLITDSIKDTDPIKWESRRLGIKFVDNLHLFTYSNTPSEFSTDLPQMAINQLTSILITLSNSGLVSKKNTNILVEELEKLSGHIFSVSRIRINEEDEETDDISFKIKEILGGNIEKQTSFIKDSIKDMSFIKKENVLNKNTNNDKGQNLEIKKTNNNLVLKIARRNSILNIIKDKKIVNLKDIQVAFPDVSTKTIQREIMSLISEGLIKQEGKKRWARYMIATN